VLAALGIGTIAGGAGWHFDAWLLFGVLGLALIIAAAVWIHGRNKP
jgi:hypothetical protein